MVRLCAASTPGGTLDDSSGLAALVMPNTGNATKLAANTHAIIHLLRLFIITGLFSCGAGNRFEIRPHLFVGGREIQDIRIRHSTPSMAGITIQFRPPVAMLREPL